MSPILMRWNMSPSIRATLSFEAMVLQGRCRWNRVVNSNRPYSTNQEIYLPNPLRSSSR